MRFTDDGPVRNTVDCSDHTSRDSEEWNEAVYSFASLFDNCPYARDVPFAMCYGQTTEEIVAAKTSRKERLAEEGHLTVGLDVGDASMNYYSQCVWRTVRAKFVVEGRFANDAGDVAKPVCFLLRLTLKCFLQGKTSL